MKLTNNQIGRIQLTLQGLLRLKSIREDGDDLKPTVDEMVDFIVVNFDRWSYQELMKIVSDLKDYYNSGKDLTA